MSILGGFDFVFQVRRDKLLDLIQENVTIQGNSLQTPFRLVSAAPPTGPIGQKLSKLDLLVTSLDLTLDPGTNVCHLKLGLAGGVIRLDQAPDAAFSGGEISIRIELVNSTLMIARPKEAALKAPATPIIATIPDFATRANAEVNKLIDAERDKDVTLFPDAPSTITAPLIFGGVNRMLDPETACSCLGNGNVADIQSSLDGSSSIALAFSADIVQRFILCRGILNPDERDPDEANPNFGLPSSTERDKLPPPCGDGELTRDVIKISRLNFTFQDGYIDVDGDFHGEDDCWHIDDGKFSQRVFLDFVGATGRVGMPEYVPARFIPRMEPDVPNLSYHLELEWYCVAAIVVGTAIQLSVVPIAYSLHATWLNFFEKMLDNSKPTAGMPVGPQPTPAFGNILWAGVGISPEGLELRGDRIGGFVTPVQQPAVHIRSTHSPQNNVATGSGPVTVQAPTCESETFNYVQYIQDDRYTLTVTNEWLFEPIQYSWTVNGLPLDSEPIISIDPTRSTMRVLKYNGIVTDVIPPPNGTQIPGHGIELQYQVGAQFFGSLLPGSGKILVLNARSADLNYDIRVEVRATDALGRVFTDAANLTMVGEIAEFDSDYYDYLNRCLKATVDLVNKKAVWKAKVKPGEPQEQLQNILEEAASQIREGDSEALALAPALTSVFGIAAVSKAVAGKAIQ